MTELRSTLQTERARASSFREAVIAQQSTTLNWVTRTIRWDTSLEEITAPSATPIGESNIHLFLVFVRQDSCDVCVSEELAFANAIASRIGRDRVRLVISGPERRYAAALVRMNEVRVPTYFDSGGRFAQANALDRSPMAFVVDTNGKVLLAHWPLPGQKSLSRPFHSAFDRILGAHVTSGSDDSLTVSLPEAPDR